MHFQINFTLHLSGMIERILLQQTLSATREEEEQAVAHPRSLQLTECLAELETTFNLSVPLSEKYYLFVMLDTQNNTQVIH